MLEELAPSPSLFIINVAAQIYPKWPTTYGRYYSHEEGCVTEEKKRENAGYVSSVWVQLGLGEA